MSLSDVVTAPTPRPAIERLVPYSPGKPIEDVKREFGLTDVIKLASNENPLGPSPKAVAAMKAALDGVNLYPDGAALALKRALSAHWGVPAEQFTLGNGSDEVIHCLGLAYLRPGDSIVRGDPSFSLYGAAALLNEAVAIKVPLTADMRHDVDAMVDAVDERTRMVFIANPNNPTGGMNTGREIEDLMDRLPPHVLLVLDEAYAEYVESPEYPASIEYVREGRPVIVLRTFSKIYGLAGLRVGYGVARPDIIRAVEQVREPFNVNSLAQAGALAALGDADHLQRSRRANSDGKRTLTEAFDRLGLPYARTEGNFILVDVRRNGREVYEALLRAGVIVRTGDVFGLPTWIRVTIGAPAENARFLCELETILRSA